jgi:hypothetical protein
VTLATKSQIAAATTFSHLETLINPAKLASLADMVLSPFQAKLRETKIKETSIASYLRQIRADMRSDRADHFRDWRNGRNCDRQTNGAVRDGPRSKTIVCDPLGTAGQTGDPTAVDAAQID